MRVKFTAKLLSQPGGAVKAEQEQHVRYTKCSNCGYSDPGGCTFSEVSFHVGALSFQFDLCEWCLTGGALTGRRSEVVFDVKLRRSNRTFTVQRLARRDITEIWKRTTRS